MTEQVSARLSDEGVKDGELRFCLNLSKEHVAKYSIEKNKYVTVKKYGEGNYIVYFHATKKIGTHRWSVNLQKKNNAICGATLQLEPKLFKLVKEEKTLGVFLNVQALENGLVFELDPENFVPREIPVSTILDFDDKLKYQFHVPSAWGEQLQINTENQIFAEIHKHLSRKFGNMIS